MTTNSSSLPQAKRVRLAALQARYRTLLGMLPTDPGQLDDLDDDQLSDRLTDFELITAAMVVINDAQQAILDEVIEAADA